jgi:succinate dehydrogenase / fumarate reductase membrane anchor subunit
VVTIAIVLLGGAVIYHAQLGLQVIIEDYIHNLFWRLTCLALNKIVAILASITLLVSLIHLMITHSTTGHI